MPQPPYPTRTDGSFGRPKSDDQAATDLDTQLQAVEYNELADWVIQLTEEIGDPDGTDPGSLWEAALAGGAGTGDVVGPAGATDNALARFDGATGKLIQNSAVLLNDTNDFSGARHLTLTGNITLSTAGATVDGIDLTDLRTDTDAHIAAANPHSGSVPTSRQVLGGNGLTGGGALTADQTLNVAATDTTITVAANGIAVNKIVAANIDCTGITDNYVLKATGGATPAWEPETGGAAGTLDQVITTTPDNDVIIPSANPIVFRDNAVADLTPLKVIKTGASDVHAPLTLEVATTKHALRISDAVLGDLRLGATELVTASGVNFTLTGGTSLGSPAASMTVVASHSFNPSTRGGVLSLKGGDGTAATSPGGHVNISGGSHTGATYGDIYIGGTSSTTAVNEILHRKGFSILESANAPVAGATPGKGQVWVRASDGALIFTDENGVDYVLNQSAVTQVIQFQGLLSGADATNWIGPNQADCFSPNYNDTYGALTGNPAIDGPYTLAPIAAFDGIVTNVDLWFRIGGVTCQGEFELWKFDPTENTTNYTATKLSDIGTWSGGGSLNTFYRFTNNPVAATVTSGDLIVLLYKCTVVQAVSYHVRCAVTIQETA